jgi:hypothetical protein
VPAASAIFLPSFYATGGAQAAPFIDHRLPPLAETRRAFAHSSKFSFALDLALEFEDGRQE